MKLKLLGKLKYEKDRVSVPFAFGKGEYAKIHNISLYFCLKELDKQKSEPVDISEDFGTNTHIWLYKDHAIQIEEMNMLPLLSDDEIKIHIKHLIYKKETKFAKIMKEVERFERFDQSNPIARENIPEDVRMYVWRRDEGRCVTCGSNKNLEFDHIIPVSEGGSNTERNLQLLCSDCNKKKSNHI